jgi:hypothetical protein
MQVTLAPLLFGLFAQVTQLEGSPPRPAEESTGSFAICTSLDTDESEVLGSRSHVRRWVRPTLESEAPLLSPRPLRTTLEDDYATGTPWLSAARSIRTTLD